MWTKPLKVQGWNFQSYTTLPSKNENVQKHVHNIFVVSIRFDPNLKLLLIYLSSDSDEIENQRR